MVLEEATSPEVSFTEPIAPSSDEDRYAAGDYNPTQLETRTPTRYPITRPGAPPVYLNLSTLPKVFGILGHAQYQVLGQATQRLANDYVKLVSRPLTQEEVDATAFHTAKTLRIASFGSPLGAAASAYLAWQGWQTYKFPFWQPGKTFNPDKFLMFRGQLARVSWQGLRVNAYLALGILGGEILMGSYAMTVGSVGRLQDPRLKEINEALKTRLGKRMEEKGIPIEDQTDAKRGGETFEMARQRQKLQEALNRARGDEMPSRRTVRQAPVDDMSPTGGSFSDDFRDAEADTGMLSDSQIQQLQQTAQKSYDRAEVDQTSTTSPSPSPSPARNAPRPTTAAPGTETKSSGSAWERLRQQAGQQTTQSPSPTQSARNSNNDSFSFSQGDEDRQLAKSEAQKDFDARLERERSGKGFDEQRGDNSSSSRW